MADAGVVTMGSQARTSPGVADDGVSGPGSWLVIVLVGVMVLAVVLGLKLVPRLSDGQSVLDELRPAMTDANVATARGGVDFVSRVIDTFDPLVLAAGGGAAEVPQLVSLLATRTGQSEQAVRADLVSRFPHVMGGLQALPLEAVTAELAPLSAYLAGVLDLPPDQALAAVLARAPRLAQTLQSLPAMTSGWAAVPGAGERFDGSPIRSATELRDYFSADVVPVIESQAENFRKVDSLPGGLGLLAPLLVAFGISIILFGVLMMLLSSGGDLTQTWSAAAWGLVVAVAVGVVLLELAVGFYPRMSAAQELLDRTEPVFVAEGAAATRAGIEFISTGVDALDPIVLATGGAAAEVPQLLQFLANQSGQSIDTIASQLAAETPHFRALLDALPLEAASAEIAPLQAHVGNLLGIAPDQVVPTLSPQFPRLAQTMASLPAVTAGWADVPNTDGTRFAGQPVDTATEVRDYFRADVLPAVESQRSQYQTVQSTWPKTTFFPPLLTVASLAVAAYGLVKFSAARNRG